MGRPIAERSEDGEFIGSSLLDLPCAARRRGKRISAAAFVPGAPAAGRALVGLITERAIRRNSFTSVRELKQQIELFVQLHNADTMPFK